MSHFGALPAAAPCRNLIRRKLKAGLIALREEFIARFNEGAEADMILADWGTAQDLIHGGYIKDLTGLVDVSQFDEAALSTVAGMCRAASRRTRSFRSSTPRRANIF